ncbi:MAG: ABC transporter substrate-binding protein [bacterium]|nr:ABC transporter substrate-binding protein [bacterium]
MTRFLILIILLATTTAFAQAPALIFSQDAETQFQRALARYIRGKYQDALLGFQKSLEQLPPNQRTSAVRLMIARSHYKLQEYSMAIATAVELQLHFPYSRYLPNSDMVIGDCYFHQGQTYAAAAQYARILTSKADLQLKSRSADRLGQMAGTGKLTDRAVESLQSNFGRAIVAEAITFGKARWPIKLDKQADATRHLSLFLEQYPNGQFASLARQTLLQTRRSAPPKPASVFATPSQIDPTELPPKITEEPTNARFKIGIIAPLGTPPGEELRDGILLARELNPLSSHDQVALIFEDSEGDPIRAAKAAQRLIDQHDIIAIIGALTSAETTPLATLLSAKKIPLIAPTASDDGIASLSPYIFQMNATPGAQGRRLADYAVRKLGLHTLATLAPRDRYGTRISKEFTARAEGLGAEVIIQEWYEEGTTDYRNQFIRIRQAGLALRPPDGFAAEVDSLLLGDIRVMPPPPVPVDPDTVQPEVVETLDGLLVAGGQEDILLIAPQFHAALIAAQILGSDGWNSPNVARDGGSYVDGATFVAKYYDQSSLQSVQDFVNAYRSRFGKDQSFVAALGYDAMLAILKALDRGARNREDLRQRLESLSDVPGAIGKIAFSKGDRENSWMYLLTIEKGRIKPLLEDEFDTP